MKRSQFIPMTPSISAAENPARRSPSRKVAEIPVASKPGRLRRKDRGRAGLRARPGPAPVAHPLDDRVRLVLAEVRADADALGADAVRESRRHLAERFERAVRAVLQVMRVEGEPQHAPRPGERREHPIRLVAPRGPPRGRVGVADGDRPLRKLDRFEGRALARMGHVDDHAEPIHLADHLAAHAGHACVLVLPPARAEQRLVVVAELHEAQAERVQRLDEAQIGLHRGRVLGSEHDGGAARGARALDIGGRAGGEDQVLMGREAPVPFHDAIDRLAEVLVVDHRACTAVTPPSRISSKILRDQRQYCSPSITTPSEAERAGVAHGSAPAMPRPRPWNNGDLVPAAPQDALPPFRPGLRDRSPPRSAVAPVA